MGNTFYFSWEVKLMEWIQSIMGDAAISLMKFFTLFGEDTILVVMLVFFYFCYDKEIGRFIGKNVALGLVLNPMIKNIFLRRRPYYDHPGIKILKKVDESADAYDIVAQGFSFPSGHSTHSTVIFGSLPFYEKGKNESDGKSVLKKIMLVLAFLIPFLVGLSRVALGAHYPTDVVAGWLLGLVVMIVMSSIQKKFADDRKKKYIVNMCILCISALGIIYCRSNDYYTGLGVMAGVFFAEMFEEHFVNFENPKNVFSAVFRLLGAFILYVVLSKLMKMPFSEEFLKSSTMGAFMFRFIRYAVASFVIFGVYPLVFKPIGMLLSKKSKNDSEN